MKNLYIILIVGLIILPILLNIILFFISRFTKIINVVKIYDLHYNRSTKLMFEDSNQNNYNVSNVWFLGKFNSLKEWNKLKIGQKYQINGYGYHINFLNIYPKVYNITQI